MLIGVISDTHGLLRPEALAALAGSDLIVHAGDVGKIEIIDRLRMIAPTYAVRGNVDTAPDTSALPETLIVSAGEKRIYVLHDIAQLSIEESSSTMATSKFAAVVFGHSHSPLIETRAGILFMNPGSAGPRRFKLPITLGLIRATGTLWQPEIVHIAS